MTREEKAIVQELESILYDSVDVHEKHGTRETYYEFHNRLTELIRAIKRGDYEEIDNPDDEGDEDEDEDED